MLLPNGTRILTTNCFICGKEAIVRKHSRNGWKVLSVTFTAGKVVMANGLPMHAACVPSGATVKAMREHYPVR